MKTKLTIFLILMTVLLIPVAGQQSMTLEELKRMGQSKGQDESVKPLKPNPVRTGHSDIRFISEGSNSKVDKPFIFVARDKETYALLAGLVEGFQPDSGIDFSKTAVVAAFSGMKSTGGFSVSISIDGGICKIEDLAPIHGAIVTEALTYPYLVVSVPVEEQISLEMSADETWQDKMERYEVTSGKFEFSGGFLGIEREFEVNGSISVMRFGSYGTMFFDFYETGNDAVRTLVEAGSGNLSGKFPSIKRIEAGELIDKPHPPFEVKAGIENSMLVLEFVPGKRDYIVSDGFEGKGKVVAELRVSN